MLLVSVSLLQCTVLAQVESAPQMRLSSKGLAYVSLSTSPAVPVTGQQTIILLQFLDPQSKAPRGDIYYKLIISNETAPIFVLPGGSTIAGKVGIPYQFDKPGAYRVQVDLNDTDISKAVAVNLDEASFPIYVSQGMPQKANQSQANTSAPVLPHVNTQSTENSSSQLGIDAALLAAALALGGFVAVRRMRARKAGPAQ